MDRKSVLRLDNEYYPSRPSQRQRADPIDGFGSASRHGDAQKSNRGHPVACSNFSGTVP